MIDLPPLTYRRRLMRRSIIAPRSFYELYPRSKLETVVRNATRIVVKDAVYMDLRARRYDNCL
jgi:hypothetical protein